MTRNEVREMLLGKILTDNEIIYYRMNPPVLEFDSLIKNDVMNLKLVDNTSFLYIKSKYFIVHLKYNIKYNYSFSLNNFPEKIKLEVDFDTVRMSSGLVSSLLYNGNYFRATKPICNKILKIIEPQMGKLKESLLSSIDVDNIESFIKAKESAKIQLNVNKSKEEEKLSKLYLDLAWEHSVEPERIVIGNNGCYAVFDSYIDTKVEAEKTINRYDPTYWAVDNDTIRDEIKLNNKKIINDLSLFGNGVLYYKYSQNKLSEIKF